VTPEQIMYHRRVRLLELADELGNISRACRQIGVSPQEVLRVESYRRPSRDRGAVAAGTAPDTGAERDPESVPIRSYRGPPTKPGHTLLPESRRQRDP
jgi:hypothetical protein